MEPRISLITLGVSDLDYTQCTFLRSIRFYRDGLKLPLREGLEGVALFETRGTWLSLYPRDALALVGDATVSPEGSGFTGFTLAHNVRLYTVYFPAPDEVDQTLREAVEAGRKVHCVYAKLIKPEQKVFWGGCSGYFADPDGFLWEVAWNPHFWVE